MPRNQAVEALRIAAAFAVVVFHSQVLGASFGGLTAFILISMTFEAASRPRDSANARALATRLLLPWAFWFAVYTLVPHALPAPSDAVSLITWILAGSSVHLWYLPFIFAAVLTFRTIRQRVAPDAILRGATLISLACVALVFVWRPVSLGLGAPYAQYAAAIPPALIGIVIGATSQRDGNGSMVLVIGAIIAAAFLGYRDPYLPVVITALALVIAMRLGPLLPTRFNVQWLSNQMMGVYLVHPLVLGMLHKHLAGAGLIYPIAAFTVSLLLVAAYRWIRAHSALQHVPALL